ncbi:hypothetical protein BS47DRAFT_741811 [Hydnum rufescens UP504]|uniref:Uncharacterized protein n=1 Tax=Hydnum rufescens UP504 TaxID=1448309 RepID=A0A9P6B139_9AGAM|nr:hypothetical protein BS47DRAFT_741811 [Hydnum rufescens UP504]
MSFAFASFTPIVPPAAPESPSSERSSPAYAASSRSSNGGFAPSNSASERHRRTYSNPSLAPFKPALSAQQIYDLAVSSVAPARPSSPGGTPLSRSRPGTPGITEQPTPAVFTPMPEEVYLPFVNRPGEVTQLLSEHPTSRLFHLLEALFPLDMRRGLGRTRGTGEGEEEDPTHWTFERLSRHLQDTTRAEMSDKIWVEYARACIRSRSEALWERFKGALGVPSELEVDNDWDDEEDEVSEPVETLEGEAAVPALLDPTVSLTTAPDLLIPTASGDIVSAQTLADEDPEDVEEPDAILEPVFADDDGEVPAHMISSGGFFPSGASEGGWSNRYMENIGEGEEETGDTAADDIPATGGDGNEEESTMDANGNAVDASAVLPSTSDYGGTPSSYIATRRAHFGIPELGDPSGEWDIPTGGHLQPSSHASNGSLREIRALQITTLPTPNSVGGASSPFATGLSSSPSASYFSSPSSHRPISMPNPEPKFGFHPSVSNVSSLVWDNRQVHNTEDTSTSTKATSPTSTSSPASGRTLRRPSESISDALNLPRDSQMYRGLGSYGLTNPNQPYHPTLSERGPGNPLFPSSFADLSVGPTLVANIPKHSRSGSVSPATHYPPALGHSFKNRERESGRVSPGSAQSASPLRRYTSLGGGGGSLAPPHSAARRATLRGNWPEAARDKYEYAVTVGSASSDGGRG